MSKFYTTKIFKEIMSKIEEASEYSMTKYTLIGGNAVDIYVNPPVTKDIDIAIEKRNQFDYQSFFVFLQQSDFKFISSEKGMFTRHTVVFKYKDIEIDFLSGFGRLYEKAIESAIEYDDYKIVKPDILFLIKVQTFKERGMDKDAIATILLWDCFDDNQRKRTIKELDKLGLLEEWAWILKGRVAYE